MCVSVVSDAGPPPTPLVYTCVFVQRIERAFIEVSFRVWDLELQFKTHRNEGMSSIEISFATRAELGGRWPLVGLPCYTQAGKLLRLLRAPAYRKNRDTSVTCEYTDWCSLVPLRSSCTLSHGDTAVAGTPRHLCYIPGSKTGLVSLRVVKHGYE